MEWYASCRSMSPGADSHSSDECFSAVTITNEDDGFLKPPLHGSMVSTRSAWSVHFTQSTHPFVQGTFKSEVFKLPWFLLFWLILRVLTQFIRFDPFYAVQYFSSEQHKPRFERHLWLSIDDKELRLIPFQRATFTAEKPTSGNLFGIWG